MRTETAAFAASEIKRFEIAGRFLRIINAADNTINIQWLKGGRVIGEALLVGSFFAVDTGTAGEDFDAFTIQSTTWQTVKFCVSQWAVEAL